MMLTNNDLSRGPGAEDDPLDERLIDTLIEDGLLDENRPIVEEVEIVDDVDVYEEDYDAMDDSFSDEVDDLDADDIEDEIDHFYGEDGTLIDPALDEADEDDLL